MSVGRRRFRALAVWLTLAALVAGAALFEHVGIHPPDDGHDDHGHGSGPRALLETPVESLAAAEIVMGDALWRFERDPAGAWTHGAAGDPEGRIAAALSVLGRARIVRELPAARDVERYGVAAPQLSLALRPHGADTPARYVFGDLAPDGLNRYVLVAGESLVVTVPEYHTDNLIGLVRSFEPG